MNTCKSVLVRNDKPKKKKISPEIRFKLWEKYVGDTLIGKCFCCNKNKITPLTNYMTFQAGHIKSEFNGGIISLDNMLPICRSCNARMNTTNWDDYVTNRGLRPRLYGGNIPLTTVATIIQIQYWWRLYKINKINKTSPANKSKKKSKKKPKKSKKKHRYYDDTHSFMLKCREKRIDKCLFWY